MVHYTRGACICSARPKEPPSILTRLSAGAHWRRVAWRCTRSLAITTRWSGSRKSARWRNGSERASMSRSCGSAPASATTRPVRGRGGRSGAPTDGALCLALLPVYPVTQALRSHVGPDFLDVGQVLRLRAGLARVPPARSVLFLQRPDRVLFFVDALLVRMQRSAPARMISDPRWRRDREAAGSGPVVRG